MEDNNQKDADESSGSLPQPSVISSSGTSVIVSSDDEPTNIAIGCAMNGNVERFLQCFDDETDPFHDSVQSLINTRGDGDNKSALDWAALLGNMVMLSELIKRGAEVNAVSEKGYSALHMAAAWNQVDSLRALVDNGADCDLKNSFDEVSRDVAVRYGNRSCTNYLDSAESGRELKTYILSMKEQFAGIDKMKTLTKEDKTLVTDLLATKLEWLEKMSGEASKDEILSVKENMENSLAPVLAKLAEADPKLKGQKKK